jgi:hypothetical protein
LSVTPITTSGQITGNTFIKLGRDGAHRLAPADFYAGVQNTVISQNRFLASNWMICRMNGANGTQFTQNYCEFTNSIGDFPLISVMSDVNTTVENKNVYVDKNIIRSIGTPTGTVIGVYQDDWSRHSVNVSVSGNYIEGEDPIRVLGSYDGLVIDGNHIITTVGTKGIYIEPHGTTGGTEANGVFRGLRVTNNTGEGQMLIVGKSGFTGTYGDECLIDGNTYGDAGFGLLTQYIPTVTITNNKFKGSSYAVTPRDATLVNVHNNILDAPGGSEIVPVTVTTLIQRRNRLVDGTALDVDDATGITTLASAATVNIYGSAPTNCVSITGSTSISAFDDAPVGVIRHVSFVGALDLVDGTSFKLPGNANITTAANDSAVFKSNGSSSWICEQYTRAATAP